MSPFTRPSATAAAAPTPGSVLADAALRRVWLVRLRVGLGDLLCTLPAVRALRTARPDLHLSVVTWPEMGRVVDRLRPYVDELVAFPGVEGIPERRPSGAYTSWVEEVRRDPPDLALQVYGDNPVASEVTAALGARVAGGFRATAGGPRFVPETSLDYPHHLHEVERHLHLLEHLGLPAGADRSLAFPLTAEDEAGAAAHGLRDYVVLHPGATSASRRWPVERFAAVGDALAARGSTVAVGGVPAEAEWTAAVVKAMAAPAVDLTGRTTLGEYAALLRDAAVVVANDTGTAHLTAAVGGRVVTVFLSGDPVRWRHEPRLQTVVRVDVGCNPCPHLVCPIDFRCADRVTVESVLAAADAYLAEGPNAAQA